MAQDGGAFLPEQLLFLGRQRLSWALAAPARPLQLPALLHTEPSASLRVQLCHLAVTSWVDLPFHHPWSRQNCWTQCTPKRPAPRQARVLYAVQFYYLNRYPIITPPTGTDRCPSTMGSDPVSPKHQPQLDSVPQTWALTLGRFLTRVQWGEQNLPAALSFARGCSGDWSARPGLDPSQIYLL